MKQNIDFFRSLSPPLLIEVYVLLKALKAERLRVQFCVLLGERFYVLLLCVHRHFNYS